MLPCVNADIYLLICVALHFSTLTFANEFQTGPTEDNWFPFNPAALFAKTNANG